MSVTDGVIRNQAFCKSVLKVSVLKKVSLTDFSLCMTPMETQSFLSMKQRRKNSIL